MFNTSEPARKRIRLMLSDRKINRELKKINKANGINIALQYQAKATLTATRQDLEEIIEALRAIGGNESTNPYKSDLIRTAKVLDKQIIPAQEKTVEQLTEMVRAGQEAATKSLISNVQRINALPNVDDTDLNLSHETLKAYNEIQDEYKELDKLDDEAYIKELLAR